MLRELKKVQQVIGEPRRRWFFAHEIDLVVWEDGDGDGAISGFQLAYDKHRNEHSISWQKDRGYSHYVVDDGEPVAGANHTPFLYMDGPFKSDRVLELFLSMSAEVPANIVACVETKLREFNGSLVP